MGAARAEREKVFGADPGMHERTPLGLARLEGVPLRVQPVPCDLVSSGLAAHRYSGATLYTHSHQTDGGANPAQGTGGTMYGTSNGIAYPGSGGGIHYGLGDLCAF
jgi:hypothetical protein